MLAANTTKIFGPPAQAVWRWAAAPSQYPVQAPPISRDCGLPARGPQSDETLWPLNTNTQGLGTAAKASCFARVLYIKQDASMSAGKQEQPIPAAGDHEMPDHVQEEQVQDKQYIATLLTQIGEHQEAYAILYNRNLLLYKELIDANQTIERLSVLGDGHAKPSTPPPPHTHTH